jgi:hypothetical protein
VPAEDATDAVKFLGVSACCGKTDVVTGSPLEAGLSPCLASVMKDIGKQIVNDAGRRSRRSGWEG